MTGRTLRYLRHNALAALALFVALGGTSFAAAGGFSASGGQLRACAREDGTLALLKAGKHCRRGQKQVAWNSHGPQGPQGKPGSTGATGASGAGGPQGAPGSALAYAHVTKSGALDAGSSKNVSDARPSLLGEGTTCVYGNIAPHNAVATVVYGESTGSETVSEISLDPKYTLSVCPSSASGAPAVALVLVRDFTSSLADLADAGYDIAFN